MRGAPLHYSAYLFDFDYTLGDSTEGIVLCVNHAMKALCLPPCGREEIRRTIGLTLPETFEQLTGLHSAELAERFSSLFKEKADAVMTANTQMITDAAPTLEYLKWKDRKTGIVTTKHHYRIDEILNKFRICHLVDCIVGCENVKNAKPDPEGLLLALAELQVPREDAVFIGDSVVDAKTAQASGVDFIAVTTGATGAEMFAGYPCRRIIRSLSELTTE